MHFFIQNLLKEYRFNRQNVVQSKKIAILHICFCFSIWTLIIVWVLVNGGHVYTSKQFKTTTVFGMNKAFETNYSAKDFAYYVQPEEMSNYNRQWSIQDYSVILPDEVQVLTNLVITNNQTMSTCPENFRFAPNYCLPNNPSKYCKKGKTTAHGTLTGRCIPADLHETPGQFNLSTCEIKGIIFPYFILNIIN